MAIVIEEEKSKSNIMGILGLIVFFAVIAGAIYYVFFAAPESVVITPPANLSVITPLSKITLHPEDVTNSQLFQSLKQYVPSSAAPSSSAIGRANPFVAPQ